MEKEYHDLKRSLMKIESMIMDIYDATVSDKKVCPICKNEIRLYLPFGNRLRYHAQCPVCRSLERHRALWLYLDKNRRFFKKDMKLLHFAPEKVFFNRFSLDNDIDYWPVDISSDYEGIRKIVDITNISFEDNSIDMIICNHVLEHIEDEKRALSELYRVLKPDGVVIIMIPVSGEATLEDPQYNTAELRLKYYGQEDHVRLYGRDFNQHLKDANFRVEEAEVYKEFSEQEIRNYSLISNDIIYLGWKN